MPGLKEAFERIGRMLELHLPHTHAAGASLAVTDGEEILGVVVRGFADAASGSAVRPETRFEIGSISKSFASIVALQQVESGRLDLHTPVSEIVPWVRLREAFGPITMHHLLTHSSGLPIGTDDSADDRFAVWNLRNISPGFAPGERFHYSNDGYKLVGVVLEHVTGRPIRELLRERIFESLGMAATEGSITNRTRTDLATGYRTVYDDRPPQERYPLVPAPWINSTSADGSIVSNVVDMSAYVRMLLARGVGPAGRLLTDESFSLLASPFVVDDEEEGWSYGYGLRLREDGGRLWRHSGGMVGYSALMTIEPDAGLGAIMLLNGDGDRATVVDFALQAVRAALAGGDLPEVGPEPDPTITLDVADYVGRYRSGDREIQLAADDGSLYLKASGMGPDIVLEPESEMKDTFVVPDPEWDRFWLRFGRDDAGRVIEATHGWDWFAGERYAGPLEFPSPPSAWEAFTGHYRAYNPWTPSFRVVIRKGRLVWITPWEDEDQDLELVPLEDGSFRVGLERWRPDRIRFDTVVEGEALRAILNEAAWYRSFTP